MVGGQCPPQGKPFRLPRRILFPTPFPQVTMGVGG
jgi:hypothetical protein